MNFKARFTQLNQNRKGDGSAFMTLDHGSPVEDVALLPNDALLVSAGGHDVKVR